MAEMDFWRQQGILPPSAIDDYSFTVIGVGGIGSPLTMALAKMGARKIRIFDHDSVETHNLPNQFYRLEDLGAKKAEAMRSICRGMAGVEIDACAEKYDSQALSPIVFSGVDSMAARRAIWSAVRYNPTVSLYVEGRMGAEIGRIYSVRPCDPQDVRGYEKTLYSDEEAVELPCTERAIIYNVFAMAGLMANQASQFIRGRAAAKEIIIDLVAPALYSKFSL